ncbi:hypothetical protein [Xenorhabdus siamensis]|uniref:hypothetical protein n=1 Tax=Xenorhabdus siamensis TaxID=3136254 RepID=UPI0030F3B575
MFKKLLTVGALAAVLIGGIGTASATNIAPCPSQRVTEKSHDDKGYLYEKYVINPYNNFAVSYIKYEDDLKQNVKWELQRKTGECLFKGSQKGFGAYYLGRVVW